MTRKAELERHIKWAQFRINYIVYPCGVISVACAGFSYVMGQRDEVTFNLLLCLLHLASYAVNTLQINRCSDELENLSVFDTETNDK
jgi:hypothetical protein